MDKSDALLLLINALEHKKRRGVSVSDLHYILMEGFSPEPNLPHDILDAVGDCRNDFRDIHVIVDDLRVAGLLKPKAIGWALSRDGKRRARAILKNTAYSQEELQRVALAMV